MYQLGAFKLASDFYSLSKQTLGRILHRGHKNTPKCFCA